MAGTKNLVLNVSAVTDQFSRAMKEANGDLASMGRASAEMARQVNEDMAKIGDDPANMARNMAKNLQAAMREAQRMAQSALSSGGGMALGGFSSEGALNTAANMEKQADAARQQAAAAEAMSAANEHQAATLRDVIVKSNAWAEALTHQAQSLREQGTAMAAVEAQMVSMGVVQTKVTEGHNGMSISGMMMMHSIRAGTDSFAAGLPPMMIFSEQLSRLAEASAYAAAESGKTTGALATFANVMGGPWGMAIVGGISILGSIIGHMDLFGDKVGDQVKKLREQAQSEDEARRAQEIYAGTLPGVISSEHKLTEELNKQITARKELTSLVSANAQGKASEAKAALNNAQRDPDLQSHNISVRVAARGRLADAQTAWQEAQDNVRRADEVRLQEKARADADPKEAARQRIEAQKDSLTRRHQLGMVSDAEYEAGYAQLDKQQDDSKKSGRKPRADHTAEREAEAEKQSDAAYREEFAAAQAKQAELARAGVTDLQTIADLDKKAVDAARLKETLATEEKGRRAKWSAVDIAALQIEQDLAAEDKKRAIDAKLARDLTAQDLTQQQNTLRAADQILTVQGQLAPTLRARLAILRQLLENERQQAVLSVQQDVNAGKLTSNQGAAKIADTNALYGSKAQLLERQNGDPVETYRQKLIAATTDIRTSFQSVEADGLKGLEDGMVGVISGTENVGSAFKKMAASILADLARIAVQKMILSALGIGGLATGGSLVGDANATIAANPAIFRDGGLPGYRSGGIPGFAGGTRLGNGMISGPGTGTSDSILALVNGTKPIMVSNEEGIVNARAVKNYWPMIDAMNKGTFPKFADGGMVDAGSVAYPAMPSASSLRSSAAAPHGSVTFDLRGAVMTEDLLAQMNVISARYAQVAIATAPGIAQQNMQDTAQRRIP